MMVQSISALVLLAVLTGCERSSRQVVFENPCAEGKAATSKNCNKPTTNNGGSGSGDSSWDSDFGSNSSQSGSKPPTNNGDGTTAPPAGEGPKPPTGGTGTGTGGLGGGTGTGTGGLGGGTGTGTGGLGGGTGTGTGTGTGGLGGGTGTPTPDTSTQNSSTPNSGTSTAGTDFTTTTKLGILVSKQGVPTLVFNGGNQSKFSNMQYSTEAFSLVAPEANLLMQGQGNQVGQFALKTSFTFKYDGKSCTGSSVAKFEVETSVTVKCQ